MGPGEARPTGEAVPHRAEVAPAHKPPLEEVNVPTEAVGEETSAWECWQKLGDVYKGQGQPLSKQEEQCIDLSSKEFLEEIKPKRIMARIENFLRNLFTEPQKPAEKIPEGEIKETFE